MSSVHKTALYNYWSTKTLSRTPFFGQYIGRNKFQDILWNLHVCDTTNNPTPRSPNHDPLAKILPLLEMCQTNFCLWYTPGQTILSMNLQCIQRKSKVTFLLILRHFIIQMNQNYFYLNSHLKLYLYFTIRF